jgi:hypothetical protein
LRKRSLRLGVDDREYLSAKNSSDEEAVTLNGHDPVLLVEN